MENIKLTENVYFFKDVVSSLFIKTGENSGLLVDTGIDKGAANKIIKLLEGLKIKNVDIFITHAHADHYGGNNQFKKKFGSKVYAPEIEESIIKYPIFEPCYLFSGAAPLNEMKNKFLMAESSPVDFVINEKQKVLYHGDAVIEIVNLKGHSINQMGVAYEGIIFVGDTLYDREVLLKHKIPFLTDVGEYLSSLEKLKDTPYDYYAGAHMGILESSELLEIVDLHICIIKKICEDLMNIFSHEKTLEESVKTILDSYKIKIGNIGQYFLMKSVIMAFISHLSNSGKISISIENNLPKIKKSV